MKNKLSILFLGSLVLTSCQIGGRAAADILLEDGSEYHFTTKQLSQEEYFLILSHLKKPIVDCKYKSTIKKCGEDTYNKTVKGEHADYSFVDGQTTNSLILFTTNIGKSFYEESRHQIDVLGEDVLLEHSETTVSYGTYNKSFDFGGTYKCRYDETYGIYEHSYNPNVPTMYPAPYETTKVRMPYMDYMAMHRTISYFGYIFRLNGIDTTITDTTIEGFDYHFYDAPVFSHKLSSKYLIVKEKRKLAEDYVAFDQNTAYAIGKMLEQSKYYSNTTYYYDYETGNLAKVEGSFNTISTMLYRGEEISGSYTLEYQNRTFDQVKSIHDNYFETVLKYPGVITYIDERQAS